MRENFLTLTGITVRIGTATILDNISWVLKAGEFWALTGPSGSGKTVLAHTLAGRHYHNGRITYHFGGDNQKHRVAVVDQQHRFKYLSNTGELYYQQRFNASEADQTITVSQELDEFGYDKNNPPHQWIDLLHIRPLLSKPLIQLSNGENKRVQLAIALLGRPDFLILDNPFIGLDAEGRSTMQQILNTLLGLKIPILLITSPREIPSSITHIACLEQGKLVFTGSREQFKPAAPLHRAPDLDLGLLKPDNPFREEPAFRTAVKMTGVSVRYGDQVILGGLDWEVKKGERWSLSGPNGSGKSTLLSLITADNPQAYANDIMLFDRQRGTGETIWDIKQRIGFVSPELHLYFDYSASSREVIASGWFDTIGLFRTLTPAQDEQVSRWIQLLKLENMGSRRLAELSAGQQRMVLLARALIKNPPLLILDEPCQGLDPLQTAEFKYLVDQVCEQFGTTLIFVSHYPEDVPSCVDHFLSLEKKDG